MTVSGSSAQLKKRKTPWTDLQESEEPHIKQRRTVRPDISPAMEYEETSCLATKSFEPSTSTAISVKTMHKLNAFRFSAFQPTDQPNEAGKTGQKDALDYKDDRGGGTAGKMSRYTEKDHSSRLIQSGRIEMARQPRFESIQCHQMMLIQNPVQQIRKAQASLLPEDTDADQDQQLQSRYKIKDHSSRLIQTGIEEMQKAQVFDAEAPRDDTFALAEATLMPYKTKDHASSLAKVVEKELEVPLKQVDLALPTSHVDPKVTRIGSTDMVDNMDDFGDLDDSIFDGSSLDGSEFEFDTPANTNGLTELDDLDDSVFEQIIADEEANFEAPSSAQPEPNRFSSDTITSPSRPSVGLMLPPKLPSSTSSAKNVQNASNHVRATTPKSPIPPFIRPLSTALVPPSCPIPNLHAAGRVVTCFRLAEMFRELFTTSPPSAIELYTIVKASIRNRDYTSQSFTFADLFFPQRPPYINGVYGKCSESELFDDDSRPFLKAGQGGQDIFARAMVRPKPKSGKRLVWNQKNGFHASEETSTEMEVEVLSIYVCSWEDIEYTKGIVMPEKEASIKKEGDQDVFYKQGKKRKFTPLKPLEKSTVLK